MKRILALLLALLCVVLIASCDAEEDDYDTDERTETDKYTSKFSLYINASGNDSTCISSSDLAVSMKLSDTVMFLIKSHSVWEKVIEEMECAYTLSYEEFTEMISIEVSDSAVMFVSVNAEQPEVAYDIAMALVDVVPQVVPTIIEGTSIKLIDYPLYPKETTNKSVWDKISEAIQ